MPDECHTLLGYWHLGSGCFLVGLHYMWLSEPWSPATKRLEYPLVDVAVGQKCPGHFQRPPGALCVGSR